MKRNATLAALLALLALSGCSMTPIDMVTPIDSHVPVAGWPALKVVEHHVSDAEVRERCSAYAPARSIVFGCTQFHFDQREAHIFVSKNVPDGRILEHERLHAAGYDHAGSNAMSLAWAEWKARNHGVHAAR